MCTAGFIKNNKSYFFRNMDIDFNLNENLIYIPRNFKLSYKHENANNDHYSILGIGKVFNNFPFYADAVNEKGLVVAGLNFIDNAKYNNYNNIKVNIAPYELPLYILSTCKNTSEVKKLLSNVNIINTPFNNEIPLTELHFLVSDLDSSIVIESTDNGLDIYDNPYNVLTNNPKFDYHIENIKNYLNLSIKDPINNIIDIDIAPYSFNLGLKGLPGDYSSTSRFIKTLVLKNNIIMVKNSVNEVFYILDSVKMINGLVKTKNDYEYTRYSIVIDMNLGIYYYKNYDSPIIKEYKLLDFINKDNLTIIKL